MDRKEFLIRLGLGAVVVACTGEMLGCGNTGNPVAPPANVDFTLDLNDPANSALKNRGGALVQNRIIIAHTMSDTYIAVSVACTHQGNSVEYVSGNNQFYCPAHGSRFASDGTVVYGPAQSPLTRYNTSLNGASLRIYS